MQQNQGNANKGHFQALYCTLEYHGANSKSQERKTIGHNLWKELFFLLLPKIKHGKMLQIILMPMIYFLFLDIFLLPKNYSQNSQTNCLVFYQSADNTKLESTEGHYHRNIQTTAACTADMSQLLHNDSLTLLLSSLLFTYNSPRFFFSKIPCTLDPLLVW